MNIAQKLKISIPEELKVIGYDGTKLIKRIAPQLSTIVQPIDEMCDVMIDLLLRRMKDPDVALEENYLFQFSYHCLNPVKRHLFRCLFILNSSFAYFPLIPKYRD